MAHHRYGNCGFSMTATPSSWWLADPATTTFSIALGLTRWKSAAACFFPLPTTRIDPDSGHRARPARCEALWGVDAVWFSYRAWMPEEGTRRRLGNHRLCSGNWSTNCPSSHARQELPRKGEGASRPLPYLMPVPEKRGGPNTRTNIGGPQFSAVGNE